MNNEGVDYDHQMNQDDEEMKINTSSSPAYL